ncbi:MAG: dGTP triphosphohydrolase [Smithella sp.]
MRILIWKLNLESGWEEMESSFAQQKKYVYATQEKEKLAYFFETTDTKHLLLLILGIEAESVKKVWLGYCFPEDYTFNLKIDFIKQLQPEEIHRLKHLYESSTIETTPHNLESAPTYFFSCDLPQKELFSIFLGMPDHPLHNHFSSNYMAYSPPITLTDYRYICEANLDRLAQKSSYALRPIADSSIHPHRNEFQRDKERLIHSKAFRRMVNKAQIYNTNKGDHYRTRITHTLEAAQIARAISRQLQLHEDLTEAIALGHDVGHTPFGHEGERQLDLIMSGKIKLAPQHVPENLGGFKHNYQALRLLNYIEEKYVEHEGLNLTYQVLEGILKHNGLKKHRPGKRDCQRCLHKCFDLRDFLIIGNIDKLHPDLDFSGECNSSNNSLTVITPLARPSSRSWPRWAISSAMATTCPSSVVHFARYIMSFIRLGNELAKISEFSLMQKMFSVR